MLAPQVVLLYEDIISMARETIGKRHAGGFVTARLSDHVYYSDSGELAREAAFSCSAGGKGKGDGGGLSNFMGAHGSMLLYQGVVPRRCAHSTVRNYVVTS